MKAGPIVRAQMFSYRAAGDRGLFAPDNLSGANEGAASTLGVCWAAQVALGFNEKQDPIGERYQASLNL